MTTTILLFIAGLVILILGAELLVRGCSRLAAAFGVSPLVIGLTIVAIGTASLRSPFLCKPQQMGKSI